MEVLGITTVGKSALELTLLYDILPQIEAYNELVIRNANSTMTPERAARLAFFSDEEHSIDKAEEAANQATFALTPLI